MNNLYFPENVDVSSIIIKPKLNEIYINLSSTLSGIQSLISIDLFKILKKIGFSQPNISIGIAGQNFHQRKVCPYTNLAEFTLDFSIAFDQTLELFFESIPETRAKRFLILQHLSKLNYDTTVLAHNFTFIHDNRKLINTTERFYSLLYKRHLPLYFQLSFVLNAIKQLVDSKYNHYSTLAHIQYNHDYVYRNIKNAGKVVIQLTEDEFSEFIEKTKMFVMANQADYTTALRGFFFGEENPIGKISFTLKKNIVADLFAQLKRVKRFPEGMSIEECKAWVSERFDVGRANQKDPSIKHALDDAFKPEKRVKRPYKTKRIDLDLELYTRQEPPRNK